MKAHDIVTTIHRLVIYFNVAECWKQQLETTRCTWTLINCQSIALTKNSQIFENNLILAQPKFRIVHGDLPWGTESDIATGNLPVSGKFIVLIVLSPNLQSGSQGKKH